jgi:uncharacterized protein (DUF885 family)
MKYRTHLAALVALLALPATLLPVSCHTLTGTELSTELWEDASGSIVDPALASLCADAWEYQLAQRPEWASRLGDPRFHGQLADHSPQATERRARSLRRFIKRAENIRLATLDDQDRITLKLLHDRWSAQLNEIEIGFDVASWNVVPRDGVHGDFLSLAPDQPIGTPEERAQLVQRWSAMPTAIQRQINNLERGLARDRVASHTACVRVIEQLDALLQTPVEDSALARPGSEPGTDEDALAEVDMATKIEVLRLVRNDIYPAFRRYRSFLQDKVLPRARDDEHPGVRWLDGGLAYYDRAILRHTSLGLTAQEVHDFGLTEVERIRRQMSELGQRVFETADVPEIQRRLRDDPELHFNTSAEVEAKAAECLARANAAMPLAFGIRPKAPCEIVRVPAHEAPFTTIAYYNGPSADGSRPGRYYINTYAPETRPRYEAEVLAYHEAVPGHHLQITIANELNGLPLVRRYNANTAFVEGWALYTERLSDELGLYSGDIDRFGVLSFDAWRACRLVVDTGLHAFGWSRQRAIDYLTENTLLATNNIENEVDRYIAWPGQALAYKVGQREILALRAQAESELGNNFDLVAFHDRVLENGGVTLAVLRNHVERWIRKESARP